MKRIIVVGGVLTACAAIAAGAAWRTRRAEPPEHVARRAAERAAERPGAASPAASAADAVGAALGAASAPPMAGTAMAATPETTGEQTLWVYRPEQHRYVQQALVLPPAA